jgi:hypothetical protein
MNKVVIGVKINLTRSLTFSRVWRECKNEVVIGVKISEDLRQEVRFMKNRSRDCS